MRKYEHQLKDKIFNIEKKRSYRKGHYNRYFYYCNDILTFDIEVTSAWKDGKNIIPYRTGEDVEYWNNLQPLALPYIWQFSFNQDVYYGRELSEFEEVLKDIPEDYKVIIWVHNLSYEFHFLNNFLEWNTVFAKSPHKPMKCVPKQYPNIEFRCTYMLTHLSLESWGKQLNVPKASGDLDYEKLRTPLTELTETEMHYCEQDCIVVYAGIKEYRRKYKNLRDIPLTQTGTVRKVVKEILMSNQEYSRHIKRLIPQSSKEYDRLMQVFAGGYTHANRMYSGQVRKEYIEHYDFASSYPTVMVAEKYPNTKWVYAGKQMPDEDEFEDEAYILKILFKNIKCKTCNTYIQASKCIGENKRLDNGRIISASELLITITEQDYLTIKETYTWESMEVIETYSSTKEYLPRDFIAYILELYHNKTTLKDVEGYEDLYMQSKQYINSMFGMCVTAIVQPNVSFDGFNWTVNQLTEEDINKKLEKLGVFSPREKRYFLSYSWGCWVTAYARRNLWKCVISCDKNVLYCDTDSIFVRGKQDFTWYNDEVTNKLKKACQEQNLDFELTRPNTPKGIPKPLGVFAPEDACCEFITLGAKRYVERRISDNKLHLTVSGINKSAVSLLNDNINNFRDGFNFDKDADCVHKQLATYVDDMPVVKYPDGYVSNYKQGINMRRTGYLLTMTDEYKQLIDYLSVDIDTLDDHIVNRLKSRFTRVNQ